MTSVLHSTYKSEKIVKLNQRGYVVMAFIVSMNANKIEIAREVERNYNVRVKKVNTLIESQKPKRIRGRKGYTSSVKKAIVRIENRSLGEV